MRVGLDLVSIQTVQDAMHTHGDRYLSRIYTPGELSDSSGTDGRPDPQRLAARFAAKEAAIKVLVPADEPIPWCEIEVVKGAAGEPRLLLTGRAARLARAGGIADIALSLTHEGGLAAAVVVAELSGAADT